MKGVPLPFHLQGKAFSDLSAQISAPPPIWKTGGCFGISEPTSVLDNRGSPSPQTSSVSAFSSLGGGTGSTDTSGMAAVSQNPLHEWLPAYERSSTSETASGGGSRKEELRADELQPIPASLEIGGVKCGLGMEEWENVLSESASSPSNDQSIFQWFPDGIDGPSLKHLVQGGATFENAYAGLEISDASFGLETVNVNASANTFGGHHFAAAPDISTWNGNFGNTSKLFPAPQSSTNPLPNFKVACNNVNPPNPTIFSSPPPPLSQTPSLLFNQQVDLPEEKPQFWNNPEQHPSQFLSPQNHPFFLPNCFQQEQHQLLPIQPKCPHPADTRFQGPKPPFAESGQELFLRQQQQTLVDQLILAAEMVEAGKHTNAREILARLNHHLSPAGKPLMRVAFYFKEALHLLLDAISTGARPASSPLDLVFKISSYKVLTEVSPLTQFVNFTSNQLLLEALDGFRRIHVIDLDIGHGGQWASLMQELALRADGRPFLKITAFFSPFSQDPLEVCLAKENLCNFAAELAIPFEFDIFNMDSLNLFSSSALPFFNERSEEEAVALNLPFWSASPTVLHLFVKHLSPRIVLSVGDRSELSFSEYIRSTLRSFTLLLESVDAANVNSQELERIEKFMIQSKIENAVLGRHRGTAEKMAPLRSFLASAGYSPMPFSNFTETQAEYLLRRLHMRGFDVEKRKAALCLCWLQGELVSVSAWIR